MSRQNNPDWVRWYPVKWLSGTFMLTPEQGWAYIQIINVILDKGHCPLDYAYLHRLCNMNKNRLKRVIEELKALGKLEESSNNLRIFRAESERNVSINFTEIQKKRRALSSKNNGLDTTRVRARAPVTTTTTTTKEARRSS